MNTLLARHKISSQEFCEMIKLIKLGIFNEHDRLELIDGNIVEMPNIGRLCVWVHTQPLKDKYQKILKFGHNETITLSQLPKIPSSVIIVNEILGGLPS